MLRIAHSGAYIRRYFSQFGKASLRPVRLAGAIGKRTFGSGRLRSAAPLMILNVQCYMRANRVDSVVLKNGQHALQAATSGKVGVLLVDLGLPDESGMDVIRAVRKVSQIPIVVISATIDSRTVSEALDAGADDYVRKPFSIIELGARVRRVLRRIEDHPMAGGGASDTPATIGRVLYESSFLRLQGPQGNTTLTDMEARILSLLLEQRGRVLTRDKLCHALWGHSWDPSNRALDVHVSKLRRKMREAGGNFNAIRVRRNVGYYLLPAEKKKAVRRVSARPAGAGPRSSTLGSKAQQA